MFWMEMKKLALSPEPGSPNGGTSLDQSAKDETLNTRDGIENAEDESMIIGDQDETEMEMTQADDENMGTAKKVARSLEEEPKSFVRGELDVKTQIDRANSRMDDAAHGTRNWEEGPDASDVNLELADKNSHSPRAKKSTGDEADNRGSERVGSQGGETGAYTDVGEGRSGVTRARADHLESSPRPH